MDLSQYLASTQLMDCTGQGTQTLTLLPDGMVKVVKGSVTVIVDPQSRSVVRPVGARVQDQIFDEAGLLAREALG